MTVGSHLGRIRPAQDLDRGLFGRVIYHLVGGHDREWFRIDPVTGKSLSNEYFQFIGFVWFYLELWNPSSYRQLSVSQRCCIGAPQ